MSLTRHVRPTTLMQGFVNELAAKTAWLRASVKRGNDARQSGSHMVGQSKWRLVDGNGLVVESHKSKVSVRFG